MTADVKLTEIANPAAVGWRWITEYEGVRRCYELCWARGTRRLTLGICGDDGRWLHTNVDQPERFGDLDGTLKGARRAAQAFVSHPSDSVSA